MFWEAYKFEYAIVYDLMSGVFLCLKHIRCKTFVGYDHDWWLHNSCRQEFISKASMMA